MTHATTSLLFRDIGPGITVGDDGTLLAWLDGPGSLLGEVDDVVRDTTLPGWAAEFDPDRTHRPRWTAQLLGVEVPASSTDLQARALIRDRPSFRRGTLGAITAAAQSVLTGSKYVQVFERDGGAYRLRVQTFTEETPNIAALTAALQAQKPAGLVLTVQVVPMSSYTALESSPTQTYTSLEAEAAQTYTALEA